MTAAQRNCQHCGNTFTPRFRAQRFCCRGCSQKATCQKNNYLHGVTSEYVDKVRAARKAFYEDNPHRFPRPIIDYAEPEAGSRDCLADPDCTRPVSRKGMCSRHAALEEGRAS